MYAVLKPHHNGVIQKHPDGPACNACLRLQKEAKPAKRAAQDDKTDEPKKSVKPKKTRNEQIRENLKVPKKKAKPVEEPVSVPKVEFHWKLTGS